MHTSNLISCKIVFTVHRSPFLHPKWIPYIWCQIILLPSEYFARFIITDNNEPKRKTCVVRTFWMVWWDDFHWQTGCAMIINNENSRKKKQRGKRKKRVNAHIHASTTPKNQHQNVKFKNANKNTNENIMLLLPV